MPRHAAPIPAGSVVPAAPAADTEPFRPRSQADLAPSGTTARIRANLAALRVLRDLQEQQRPATGEEQQILARWSSWGAVSQATFARPEYAWARDELAELLTRDEYAAAMAATINAHYTDAAIVQRIWHALGELGFTGGQVLEPGSGSGHFIAFAPPGAQMTGIELDPTSAAISRALYPQAQILTESFADTRAPEGTFDLTVGNVPFGNVTLHDPRHNRGRHSLHNHFIIKSLHLTRPGGLVAVITSAYTMDAPTNLGARREMAQLADLVGAVRLPTGAHRRAAGTDVVTDLLILRRREDDREPADVAWDLTREVTLGEHTLPVNGYFLDHPELVLGTLGTGNGPHADAELRVDGPADASLLLGEALTRITLQAKAAGLNYTPATTAPQPRPIALIPAAERKPDGYLQTTPAGGFTRVVDGLPQPHRVPATQAAELRALLGLRDTQMALLAAESASNDDTDQVRELRTELNRRYDAYQATYGCIERFEWRSRVDKRTGKTIESKHRPGQGGFRHDPFAAYVRALENFDPIEQTATKAEVFHHRVVGRRPQRLAADSPADAIAICLDRHGELRLDQVAELLGVDEPAARAALGELVFDEPDSNRVVLAAEYLSGDVRAKLAAAQNAVLDDPRYQVNVAALTEVIPTDLLPEEIHCRLGGAWVDAAYVQQFLRETFEDDSVRVDHPGSSNWFVYTNRPDTVIATRQWGIPQLPAHEIAQAVLRKSKIEVTYEGPNHTRLLDPEATAVAADKARELDERFGEWVWEDPARAEALARVYNDRFNNWVPREYDGSYLSLPGLALSFQPRAHQLAAVERIITDRAIGLVHDVGAGKTSEMVIGVMELRRLGFVNKPIVAVPRNVIDQFRAEWLQRYPQAKLLVATSDDMTPANRATFIGRAAAGDWDAVLMTHGALERVPVSHGVRQAYLDRRVAQLRAQMDHAAAQGMHGSTIKQMEKQVLAMEERFKRLMDGAKDDGPTFDQAGFDYLVIDEAHLFKNLILMTSIPDLVVTGSQRATDLHMKFEWLREQGQRIGVMATATPFANKMLSEMYNWQLFLNPQGLADRGIHSFEQFIATFGVEVSALEVDLVGKLAVKTRLNSVVNVPELMRPVLATSDIKTAEDLRLPTPLLVERDDGKRLPETVPVPASGAHLQLMAELADRADDVRNRVVDRSVDNMLKIGNDGRYAALDLRLIGRDTDETTKVDVVADQVYQLWQEHRDDEFLDAKGQPEPRRGALQIVFCDLGTPGPKGCPKTRRDEEGREIRLWTFYEELRAQLAARGMPPEMVRFIHEADSDQAKGELFAACNRGQAAVLVGSTGMMGVGTNVQKRAVALHHVDVPWRPADIRQRNGRILRQGNQHPEVRILNYVTERSVDGYVWQRVQSKAHLLDQVMRGRSGVRVIENPDDMVITAGMIKAAAVGNPLLMEKEELEARLGQLERKQRNYQSSQRAYKHTARSKAQDHTIYTAAAAEAEQALAQRINTRGEAFRMTMQGQTFTSRPDADAALHQVMASLPPGAGSRQVGSIGGFPIHATTSTGEITKRIVTFTLAGVPQGEVMVFATGVEHGRRVAVVTRLENRLYDIERVLTALRQAAATAAAESERAQARIGTPFAEQEQLDQLRARLTEVNAQLREDSKTKGDNPTSQGTTEPSTATQAAVAVDPADQELVPISFDTTSTPSTDRVLQVALVLAEQHGWLSRREATEHGGTATADLVREVFAGGPAGQALRQQVAANLTRGIVRRAAAARTWARNLSGASDYQRNLRAAAADEHVEARDLATVVSAIGGYLRHEDDQTVAAQASASQWQGREGDPLRVASARVVSVRTRTTQYGESHTLRMIDGQGNLYTWTTNTDQQVREGDVVTFNGRVKTHGLWQDRRETQLTRATVTVIAAAPDPATPTAGPASTPEPVAAAPDPATPPPSPVPQPAPAADPTQPAEQPLPELAAAVLPRPASWTEVPVDSELDIDWFGQPADRLSHPPTSYDRHAVQTAAADVACDHALQAGAVAGHRTGFITDFTARLDLVLRRQLNSEALPDSRFWQDYQRDADLRGQMLGAAAAVAFTTIRAQAGRVGLTIGPLPTPAPASHPEPSPTVAGAPPTIGDNPVAVSGTEPAAGPWPRTEQLLARLNPILDPAQRHWLLEHITPLVHDGQLHAQARANDIDKFRQLFPERVDDVFAAAFGEPGGEAIARWYFNLDRFQQAMLTGAAAHDAYETVNQAVDAARQRLTEAIDLDGWLRTQTDPVRRTPAYLTTWLRERIAVAATDLRAERAARLDDIAGFREVFERGLRAAISAGWDEHQLADVELFRRFAHDEQFAAQLTAAAGQAVYVALRSGFVDPAGSGPLATIPTNRQQVLTRAITDHAARYAGPHAAAQLNPARYIAEAHVPGGATRAEWDWIGYHLATHPEVLQTRPLTPEQLVARDRAERDETTRRVGDLLAQAQAALDRADPDAALGLVEQAEGIDPSGDWAAVRDMIRSTSPGEDGPPPATTSEAPPQAAPTTADRPPPAGPITPAATSPAGEPADRLSPDRRAQLIKAITDHASRYTAANTNGLLHDPARYVAEAHVPGGASRDEWDWIAAVQHDPPPVATAAQLPTAARALAARLGELATAPPDDDTAQRLAALVVEQLHLPEAAARAVASQLVELVTDPGPDTNGADPVDAAPPGAPTPQAPAQPGPAPGPALDSAAALRLTGGQPFTSANRIRGPLRTVKTACNQLTRTREWSTAGTAPAALATTIDRFKAMSVDTTPPRELLATAVQLAGQARDLRNARYHPGVDPVLAMLHELARMSGDFAANLVATALKDNRWQRVFGEPAPPLHFADAGMSPPTDPPAAAPPGAAASEPPPGLFTLDAPAPAGTARLAFPRPPQSGSVPAPRPTPDAGTRLLDPRRLRSR